jgi:hypothetical protein
MLQEKKLKKILIYLFIYFYKKVKPAGAQQSPRYWGLCCGSTRIEIFQEKDFKNWRKKAFKKN